LKSLRNQEDELSLSEFWDAYEVNKLQIEEMTSTETLLQELKDEVTLQQNEVKEKKANLETEIDENLKRIQKLKTPKCKRSNRLFESC
jgi:tRNA(Ile2) C34 agmatinyltransferase TiaS